MHSRLVAHQARAYPSFSSMKQLGVFFPLDGMLAHRRVTPPVNSPVMVERQGVTSTECEN